MKKVTKILGLVTALVLGFTGCSDDTDAPVLSDTHTHSYSETYSSDETGHWYAATCEHHSEKKDFAEHTFGEWEITVLPTEKTDGKQEKECGTCHYKTEESIAKLNHTHIFAEAYTSDETGHWYAATCDHTTEKKDYEEHDYYVFKNTATCLTDGVVTYKCTACGYEKSQHSLKTGHYFVKVSNIEYRCKNCNEFYKKYYKIDSQIGFYCSINDGSMKFGSLSAGFTKDQIKNISECYVSNSGNEEVEVVISKENLNFNNQTPASLFTERFPSGIKESGTVKASDFIYDVSIYNGDELLFDENNNPLSLTAYIGHLGDVDLNFYVDVADVSFIVNYSAYVQAGFDKSIPITDNIIEGKDSDLDNFQKYLADVSLKRESDNCLIDHNERNIEIQDASLILSFYAKVSANIGPVPEIWNSTLPQKQ